MGNRNSIEKLTEYWEKWDTDRDNEIKDKIVISYMPLVDYVADRVAINLPSSVQKDDLKSLGYIGLLEAVDRFDIARGLKFETFAMWRIKGAIIDGLRKSDWVPRGIRKKAKELENAIQELQSSQKEPVNDIQIAEHIGITIEEYNQLISEVQIASFVSIDDTVGEEGNQFRDIIPDNKSKTPEQQLDINEVSDLLSTAIDKLPEKERTVISLYYYEELTLTEIAKILDVSTSRISQLHTKATMRLRGFLNRQKRQLF